MMDKYSFSDWSFRRNLEKNNKYYFNRVVENETRGIYNRLQTVQKDYWRNFRGEFANGGATGMEYTKPFGQILLATASAPFVIMVAPAIASSSIASTAVANMTIHATLQKTITGKVDYVDAAVAGIPGGKFIQAAKPALMASTNWYSKDNGGFQTVFDGSKSIPSTAIDLTTGYINYGIGFGASSNNALQNYNQVPLNAYTNGGDIFMNTLLNK